MMKPITIAILADAGSTHTVKWVNALSDDKGLCVHLVSLRSPKENTISKVVKVHVLENLNQRKSDWVKLGYFKKSKQIQSIISTINPDFLHAYYATSYGALGRMCNHPNFLISVWGSDVYEFPKKSFLHKLMLKRNLSAAKHIFSTSEDMKKETQKYTSKPISVIPFGVDVKHFSPGKRDIHEELVFGTVKTMEHVYGIDILIRSFAKFIQQFKGATKLLIAGDGSQMLEYKELVQELGIDQQVKFLGYINQSEIPKVLSQMDVFMVLSRRESFGVAAVEAAACGLPVIASNTGGLPEVVEHQKTGVIVPVENINATVEAMIKLSDQGLRNDMGNAGREMVEEKYNWEENVNQMINSYKQLFSKIG